MTVMDDDNKNDLIGIGELAGKPVDGRAVVEYCREKLKMNAIRFSPGKKPTIASGTVPYRDFEEQCAALNKGGKNDGNFAVSISKQTDMAVLFCDSDVDIMGLPAGLRNEFTIIRERKPDVWGGKFLMVIKDITQKEADAYAKKYRALQTGVELYGTGQNLIVSGTFLQKDEEGGMSTWVCRDKGIGVWGFGITTTWEWVQDTFPIPKKPGVAKDITACGVMVKENGRHHFLRGDIMRWVHGKKKEDLEKLNDDPVEVLLKERGDYYEIKIEKWSADFVESTAGRSEIAGLIKWCLGKLKSDGKSGTNAVETKALKDMTMEEFDLCVAKDNNDLFLWNGVHLEGPGSAYNPEQQIIDWLCKISENVTPQVGEYAIKLLKNDGDLKILRDELDSKNGVAFRNGFYDFDTGKLVDNDISNMNTSFIDADLVLPPADKCPADGEDWDQKHVEEILGGTPLWDTLLGCFQDPKTSIPRWETGVHLLLEVMSLAIRPVKGIPKIIFNVGRGSNGKTMMWDYFTAVFGEFVSSVSPQMLMEDRFAMSSLDGVHINYDDEIDREKIEGAGKLKKIADCGKMSMQRKGDPMYHAFVRCLMVFCMNEIPAIADKTYGLGRRLCVIEWPRIFADEDKDMGLPLKLAADTEATAKLMGLLVMMRIRMVARGNMLRSGCVELSDEDIVAAGGSKDLAESDAILGRTDMLSHPLKKFMYERVKHDDFWYTSKNVFYEAYEIACKAGGINPWGKPSVGKYVKEDFDEDMVYVDPSHRNVRCWVGMMLLSPDGAASDKCRPNPKQEGLEGMMTQQNNGQFGASVTDPPPPPPKPPADNESV